MCNQLPVDLLRSMADEHEAQIAAARGPVVPYTPPKSEQGADRARKYGLAALAGIADTVASAPQGKRHPTLYARARKVAVLAREGLITDSEGRAALRSAAQGTDNERDIERTINDGIEKGRGDSADWLPDFDTPTIHNTPSDMQIAPPEFYEIPNPRYFPQGVPKALISGAEGERFNIGLQVHLNPWYHSAPRDIPNPGPFWHGYAIVTELAASGDIDSACWSIDEIADKNTRGVNYQAIRRFTQHLFSGFALKENNDPYREKGENNSPGRPTTYFELLPVKDFWRNLWDYLEPLAWRALLVHDFPHIPIEAVDLHDVLDTDLDTLGDIDDQCLALYAAHGDEIAAAAKQFRARMDYHRRLYDFDQWLMGEYEPLVLADGVQFPTVKDFRNAIRDHELDRFGGVYEDRHVLAAKTGRGLTGHRVAAEQSGILAIPVFKEYPVPFEGHVLPQAAMLDDYALERRRVILRAGNGDEMTVTPNRNWGSWLDDRGGREGAVFRVWDRTIDKRDTGELITDDEREDRAMIKRRQKAASDLHQPETETTDKPRGKFAQWLHDQGAMRAPIFNVSPESDDVWGDILRQVSTQEGATMPTMTAHSEPRESEVIERPDNLASNITAVAGATPVTDEITPEDRTVSDPAPQGDPSLETVSSSGDPDLKPPPEEVPSRDFHPAPAPQGDPIFKTLGDPMSNTPPEISLRKEKSNRGDPGLKIEKQKVGDPNFNPPPELSTRVDKRPPTGHTCECGQPATGMIPGAWVCDDCRDQRTAAARMRILASVAADSEAAR